MTQYYEIRLKGHLDPYWSDWFGELLIKRQDDGETILTGPIEDQAALHGLLNRVRDSGIMLIAVNPISAPTASAPTVAPTVNDEPST
ncbi:MAG: hypothetical protein U0528_15640 [Anaerolineae bacterium]|nr:hypothetical protein [Anaerolineae bacterium]